LKGIRLFLAFVITGAAVATLALGAGHAATRKPEIPFVSYGGFASTGSSHGTKYDDALDFTLRKRLVLRITYVRTTLVKRITANPKPTKWVHGNPVWTKKYLRKLPQGQERIWVRVAFRRHPSPRRIEWIISSRGYRPTVYQSVQRDKKHS
jgi:hypothetical protein